MQCSNPRRRLDSDMSRLDITPPLPQYTQSSSDLWLIIAAAVVLAKCISAQNQREVIASRKEEINKLHVKVKNEIKKKKEARAKERQLEEAQNHEEDEDFLDMDFE